MAKKKTTATVVSMIILAAGIILLYYYWTNRTEPLSNSEKSKSEAQKFIDKDLVQHYPETPKEVTKLFAGMMKALYDTPKENEVKPLALKIRQLYDGELLANNPENTYLTNLYTDLAVWKKQNRKITNYLLIREEEEQDKEIDGVKYATKYISFTIQQNIKFTETWKVLLRQDANMRWKILGWDLIKDENNNSKN